MKKIIKSRDITNNIEPYRLKLIKKSMNKQTAQSQMNTKDMINNISQLIEKMSQMIKREDDQIKELINTKQIRRQESFENLNKIAHKMNEAIARMPQ